MGTPSPNSPHLSTLGSSPHYQQHQYNAAAAVPWRSTSPSGGGGGSPSPGSGGGPIICDEGCTLHSDVVHDAAKLLRAFRSIPDRFILGGGTSGPGRNPGGGGGWSGNRGQQQQQQQPWEGGTDMMMLGDHYDVPLLDVNGIWPFSNPSQPQGQGQGLVPQPPSRPISQPQPVQNADLLRIYVKLLSQFKASLDGNPDASNPYIKYHVPYCVQSPLLQHVAIYTAAGLLSQTGHIEGTVAMAHKGHAIKLLNEHLRSRSSTSDEGIAGVVQLIVNEWYWGDANDLQAHLRGLREMIKLRGGFRTLGLHGLISKLAITSDVAIALSFEISPFLQGGGGEFDFQDNPAQVPLRLALNTPLISPLARFTTCDEALNIHAATASILDDMRFLINAVLTLPEEASPKELQKVHTTSAWIYKRISGLPASSPTAPHAGHHSSSPRDVSPAPSSSVASSTLSPDITHTTASVSSSFRGRGTSEELRPPIGHDQPRRRSFQANTPESTPGAKLAPNSTLSSAHHSSAGTPTNDPEPEPDYIYQAVRLAALLYSRAITLRQPFSATVMVEEFLQLWTTAWRVPLVTWRGLLGVLNWLLLPLLPSGKVTPHDMYTKTLMSASLLQMGMDNWEICRGVMENGVRLQRWLSGDREGGESSPGSEFDDGKATTRWRRGSHASSGDLGSERGGGSQEGKEKGKGVLAMAQGGGE
ncbi:hypothetical protein B0H66DRAFT_599332 [Apodospora peruviana]|uniref:Uncharacterized protein n=1 Tax=Apodospora peruviana TaxID=516989 RepID=A0AAE0IHQ9_9PEZI|nr:hypothetical protein B0H66DRAFT_599332 [Apodospora peruviana]